MTSFKISAVMVGACLLAIAAVAFKKNIRQNEPGKGFAVVELFTSEGCSSCPPADALIAKIQKEDTDKPVYILAYHVDYWNRLGWKDAFSSHAYSQRQAQYVQWLHLSSPYTPQAVVNGRTEFVGSEEGTLRNAIKNGLQKPAHSALSLNNLKSSANNVTFAFTASGSDVKTQLIVALVPKQAQTQVKSGENGGRTLSHVQIVRAVTSIALNGKTNGAASIALPPKADANGYQLIAFLQNTANGQIIAAARGILTTQTSANSYTVKHNDQTNFN